MAAAGVDEAGCGRRNLFCDSKQELPRRLMTRGAPLQVCFILSSRGNVFGGLETIADNLASGLARLGHEVTLLAGTHLTRSRRNDFPPGVEPIYVPSISHTSALLRSAARVAHCSPLNLQSLTFFLSCLSHRDARRRLVRASVAVTFLEGEAMLFSRYLARRSVGSIYYFSGGIDAGWAYRDRSTLRVAISQVIADRYEREHGYLCQAVVTPGIASEILVAPLAAERRESGPRRLLYVGRLEHLKQVDRLLPVVSALVRESPGLTLRIVGDGPARLSLKRQVREDGLDGHVVFCGSQPHAEVLAELRQADVLLFPSVTESFGIVALEALAAGVPVVASDLPALREATGGNAALLPSNDLAAWIDATRRLISNDELRRTCAVRGRAWAEKFTWDKIVDKFEGLLYETASATGR
jgi:glycosyltransferase involved in cell wall biosynthesis